MEEVRENVEAEEKFVVDEKKAEEALLYIREVCTNTNACRKCIYGVPDKGVCSIINNDAPSTWKLMCDGYNGKLFR